MNNQHLYLYKSTIGTRQPTCSYTSEFDSKNNVWWTKCTDFINWCTLRSKKWKVSTAYATFGTVKHGHGTQPAKRCINNSWK